MRKKKKDSIVLSSMKVSILDKIRYRKQSQVYNNKCVHLPLLKTSFQQSTTAAFLNDSYNCAERSRSSKTCTIRKPSLIAIDIDDDEFRVKQSLIELTHNNGTSTISSYCFGSRTMHIRSTPSVHKQTSDSIIFVHRYRPTINHHYSKQKILSDYSPHNTNSITNDSHTSSSNSDILTSLNRTKDKTWRLKIHDDLNKDGSRHNVMHKGSEESIRRRRQNKREKRSEEKKRKIEEKILQANQRWQKYSNIDYELVFFISRYYDQLPLCSNCRNYFVTYQTQFLSEDPRASLDYAADAVLNSPNHKTMTMKQAAKSRLIQDYDKQSDILFNLCDTCLKKCEQIRNELKEINFTRKMSQLSDPSNINMTPDIPLSPNISEMHDHLYSSNISSPINVNIVQQQEIKSTSDLNQIYMNNLIQNHQIRLHQLYEQSQNILIAQQYQQNLPNNQSQLHYELQSCIKQMQYHCLEILHLQYPGCLLSFPYIPSSNSENLSYRYSQNNDESIDSENSSSPSEDNDTDSIFDQYRSSPKQCNINQSSMDDRLTIETCHGLIEYCNAPIDDFIRGLQVLQCLSNFNRYPI